MRIKRYRAKDIKTALQMIKDELGSEAVILSTREIKDAEEWGPMVEVTAGVGYQAEPAAKPAEKPEVRKVKRDKPSPAVKKEKAAPGPDLSALEGGLAEIKNMLMDLTHRSSLSERIRDRKDLLRLYRDLLDNEMEPSIARTLVEKAAESNGRGVNPVKALEQRLARLLRTSRPFERIAGRNPRYIALVGPSGVGKTTTLAKLAARLSVKEQKKVGLISLDDIKLGAAEQLKTFARIIGLPVMIVQDKNELKQAIELFENMDVVLMDTSSRLLSRDSDRDELAELVKDIKDIEIMLVLSAVTKDRDIAAAIGMSAGLPVESLIISKIDETQRYGNVINNLIKSKKPVSFLTNGPKVPDDIIPADPDRLAGLITAGARTPQEKC